MTDRHPDPDQLTALALADLSSQEQEQLSAHLVVCSACRADYAVLADGVQQALTTTPAVAPPAGFSGRVLAAMGSSQPPRDGRPALRALWVPMAAAVLLGLLAGVGGTLVVNSWNRAPASSASHQPVASQLVTRGGDVVGTAGLATLKGTSYVVLNVTQGKADATYECILVDSEGRRTSGGTWKLTDEYGSGTATGSWLVPITGDPPVRVELVAPSGTLWARGSF